jgi:hypothetical protein
LGENPDIAVLIEGPIMILMWSGPIADNFMTKRATAILF